MWPPFFVGFAACTYVFVQLTAYRSTLVQFGTPPLMAAILLFLLMGFFLLLTGRGKIVEVASIHLGIIFGLMASMMVLPALIPETKLLDLGLFLGVCLVLLVPGVIGLLVSAIRTDNPEMSRQAAVSMAFSCFGIFLGSLTGVAFGVWCRAIPP